MPSWDPVILFVLICIGVIVLGPSEYVPLAGFGIMGAIATVLVGGRCDLVFPVFTLAFAGAVLLGVRTVLMLVGRLISTVTRPPGDQLQPRDPDIAPDDAYRRR